MPVVGRFAGCCVGGDDRDLSRLVVGDGDGRCVGGSDRDVGVARGDGIQGDGDVFVVFEQAVVERCQVDRGGRVASADGDGASERCEIAAGSGVSTDGVADGRVGVADVRQ